MYKGYPMESMKAFIFEPIGKSYQLASWVLSVVGETPYRALIQKDAGSNPMDIYLLTV